MTSRCSTGSAASAAWADSGSTRRRRGPRAGLEPGGALRRGLGLVPAPPPPGDPGVDRPVADRPEQPGRRVERRRRLCRQLHERLLDHVLGLVAPLPRVELQRGGVPVDQPPEQF